MTPSVLLCEDAVYEILGSVKIFNLAGIAIGCQKFSKMHTHGKEIKRESFSVQGEKYGN